MLTKVLIKTTLYIHRDVVVGFLKFLKREKKDELEELDLPPAPPPLGGFDENLPEFPEFPEEIPEFKFPEKEDMPELGEKKTIFEFPSLPDIEEKPIEPIQPISATTPMPQPQSLSRPMLEVERVPKEEELQVTQPYYKIGKGLFHHEKRIRNIPSGKTLYVRVDKFKATLGSINIVRNDLRKSEEALMKLENIKNAKDRSFERIKSSLDDLQKKLIFVDKTLFKGE